MKNKYQPHPANLDGVRLPDELSPLIEQMSENVHEVWAQLRMDQGWTYGGVRDDQRKEHPCLVPYGDLPECEKEFDRNTAVSTLKLILSLGYDIVPKSSKGDAEE